MKNSEQPKRGRGRPRGSTKAEKIAVTIMLPIATKDRLETVAEQTGATRSAYVDLALRNQFRKDKIT
jgi:hypothetical protein